MMTTSKKIKKILIPLKFRVKPFLGLAQLSKILFTLIFSTFCGATKLCWGSPGTPPPPHDKFMSVGQTPYYRFRFRYVNKAQISIKKTTLST